MNIGKKEESSLTREEACYEELAELFTRRSRSSWKPSFSENQQLVRLEDVQRISRECPEAFRLKDRNGSTLLHRACYSEGVTLDILALLHKMNPDAIHRTVDVSRRTAVECMAYNRHAPHDAFSFLMEKSKDMRDPYDYFVELRFLCQNERFPVTASKLRVVVEACPEAASMQPNDEQYGIHDSSTTLQILCSNETATLEAVEYLHGAYPDAISLGDHGFPLHTACAYCLPLEIIHFLIDQYPEATRVNHSGTPLHQYLRAKMDGRSIKILIDRERQSNDGESMIQSSGIDIKLVRRFIEIFPQALEVRTDHEGTPLHILFSMMREFSDSMELMALIIEMAQISPAALRVQGGKTYPLLHCLMRGYTDVLIDLFQPLVDIDSTLLNLPTSDGGQLPIHVLCSRLHYSKSKKLLKCIIERAPETVMVADVHGNLPLHKLLLSYKDVPLEALELLVECNNAMLKVTNSSGDLAVHLACKKYGSPTLRNVQYLVTKYPECTKARNNFGCSPLDLAIENPLHQDTVDFLLEKDPDIALEIPTGGTPPTFHRACRSGSLETIKKIHKIRPDLLQTANDRQELPLLFAIAGEQDLGTIGFLIQEFPNSVALKDSEGFLPFHRACSVEDPDMTLTEILFKCYPAAIHTPVNDGRLPINIFCSRPVFSHVALKVLQFLACQLPYSLTICDADGRYPLHHFCQQLDGTMDKEDARETFVKLHELNPDAISHESKEFGLPIHCACKSRCGLEILKQMVELYPESINHKHNTLGLPLHCSIDHHDEFEFLLEKRYCNYAEQHGRFFLHALLEDEGVDRKEDLANALINLFQYRDDPYLTMSSFKKDAEIERKKDHQGRLPLHLAVSVPGGLDENFVKKLIGMYPGALGYKDHHGMLPLHHAFQNGAPSTILYMLMDHDSDAMTARDQNSCLPFHLGCQSHRGQNFMKIFIDNHGYFAYLGLDIQELCKQIANNGDLPLHKACVGGNLDCISSLVAAYPDAVRTRNNSGMLPVFLLCQEFGKNNYDFEAEGEQYIGAIFDLLRQTPEITSVHRRTSPRHGPIAKRARK